MLTPRTATYWVRSASLIFSRISVGSGSCFISICRKIVWNFGTMPTTRPTVIDGIRTSEMIG